MSLLKRAILTSGNTIKYVACDIPTFAEPETKINHITAISCPYNFHYGINLLNLPNLQTYSIEGAVPPLDHLDHLINQDVRIFLHYLLYDNLKIWGKNGSTPYGQCEIEFPLNPKLRRLDGVHPNFLIKISSN